MKKDQQSWQLHHKKYIEVKRKGLPFVFLGLRSNCNSSKQTHYFEGKGQAKRVCLIVLSKVNPHDLWQVVLQCEVEANPEPSIQWTWQGTPVINGSQSGQGRAVFHITQWGLRVKTSNLTIQNAQADLGGSFQCQGFNKAGKVQSELNLGKLK